MPSTYTTNLGIEKIATGEQSGTWGTTTNTNFDLIDTAVNGIVSITLSSAGNSGSPNDLPITDGTASNGRNKFIEFTDGGDLGATAYVQLTPNDAEKIVHIRNSLSGSRSIIVFQGTYSASNDFEIPNGADVTLKFNGGGSGATVTDVNVDLTVTGATIATADINGGTIDGTVIGGSSAAAGTFTTFTSTGIDDNATSTAITIDSSENVSISPSGGIITLGANGHLTSKQSLDVATAGGRYIGASNRGTVGQIRIEQTATSADGGYVSFDTCASGSTSPTERMRIDSSGNVGIGTSSPVDKLHVYSGASGGSAHSYSQLVVENSTHNAIQLLSPDSSEQALWFGDASSSTAGGVTYYHPDNIMTFRSNGSERMRIDASGNVGIGTTSPSYKLDVDVGAPASQDQLLGRFSSQAGTRSIAFVWDDSASTLGIGTQTNHAMAFHINGSSAEKMRIDTSGNVGIGTTSPSSYNSIMNDLVVAGSADSGITIASGTSSEGSIAFADGTSGADAYRGWINYNHNSNFMRFSTNATERMRINSSGEIQIGGTSNAGFVDFDGDGLQFNTQRNPNTGAFVNTGKTHASIVMSGAAAGVNGGSLIRFHTTTANNTVATERMRVDPSGNVGIGTTSPNKPLEISKTGGGAVIRLNNPDSTVSSGESLGSIEWQSNDASTPGGTGTQAIINVIDTNTFGTAYAMTFTTSDSGTTAERMRISSAGNVGIGTTSPAEALNIVGTGGTAKIRFDGDSSNLQNNFIGITGYDDLIIASDEANSGSASTIQFRVDASERMRVDASGNLLIGTTSTVSAGDEGIQLGSNGMISTARNQTSTQYHMAFVNPNGTVGAITTLNNGTSYLPTSDARLKENIRDYDNALADVMKLKPRKYSWKTDGSEDNGFVAQELLEIPEFANRAMPMEEGDDPKYGVDYMKFVAVLTGAIQEQQAMIEELKAEVAALKGA